MFKKTTCPECGAMWNERVYDACPNCGWVVGADTPLKRAREEAERIEQEEKKRKEQEEKEKEKQRLEEEQKRQEQERIRLEYEHAKKLKEEEEEAAEILRTIGSRKVNPKIEKQCRTVAVLVGALSFVFSLACFIVGFYFVFEISGMYVTGGFTLLVGGGIFLIIGIMSVAFMDLLVNIFACLFDINEALRNYR